MPDREPARPGQLGVEVRRTSDRAIVRLSGELDLASAPLLEREIEDVRGEEGALVLDLDALEFIDSTGLRLILAEYERTTKGGRGFAVTKGSKQVQRLLEITGVSERLPIIESPEALLV